MLHSRIKHIGLAGLLVAAVVGLGLWAAQPRPSDQPNASVVLDQLADQTLDSVMRVVTPAVERTHRVATDDAIHAALAQRDIEAITALINERVLDATEVDVISVFDAEGEILAINTVYNDGRPIPQERVDAVMSRSFENRDIIQSCTRNTNTTSALEFQTGCDITPAFFDSSGLSVAYTVPMVDARTGERIGVVSTRLRFERVLELINDQSVGAGTDAIYFVTDQGGYFDENINSGQAPPPIPSKSLQAVTTQLAQGNISQTNTRIMADNQTKHVGLYRLGDVQTLDGGGINLMLSIEQAWLMREAKQAAMIRALGLMLLLLLLAGTAAWAMRARRHRHAMAATIDDLHAAEASRDQTQQKLMAASRLAGMAEVATSLLHNVGNVLNSVNTSTSVAATRTKQLPVKHLEQAAGMIQDHRDELGTFLTQDPKGSRLPAFLENLAQSMGQEQSEILSEMDKLTSRLDHIRHIIDGQKKHDASTLILQPVAIQPLLDQALEINGTPQDNAAIEIKLQLEGPDSFESDHHLLMQVLVNLLSNAKRSVGKSDQAAPKITVGTRHQPAGQKPGVCLWVHDNGVGISEENLVQIFQHGFSTCEEGRGFGLHSAANNAQKMGGQLTAHSDGPGCGALFELTLPLTAPETPKSPTQDTRPPHHASEKEATRAKGAVAR